MNTKHSPVSAAEARDEIRNYIAAELERPVTDVQAKVVFNMNLPWVDGAVQPCYLVEWFAGLRNGVAIAGPYTYNLPELNVGEARQLGSVNEWRQQLLNLYAGCEIATRARLTQPFADQPDPTRTRLLLEALQNRKAPRFVIRCSVREFLRVGTDEYYVFNGDWVHNPHFSYSATFGFKPRQEDTTLHLPEDQSTIRIAPHRFLQPVPPVGPDGAYPGEQTGFIMMKNGNIIEYMASSITRPVADKVALYYMLGQENGPFAITR
jgi:hypothetical protein